MRVKKQPDEPSSHGVVTIDPSDSLRFLVKPKLMLILTRLPVVDAEQRNWLVDMSKGYVVLFQAQHPLPVAAQAVPWIEHRAGFQEGIRRTNRAQCGTVQ